MRVPTFMIRFLAILALVANVVLSPFTAAPLAAEVICDGAVASSPGEATPAVTPSAPDAVFPDDGGTLTVYAAASLTDAFAEMETRLEDAYPELDIVIETAGSQTLVTQIDQGAPADVLATANSASMEQAVGLGLIYGEPIPFTGNELVIVAPTDNPAGIESLADLGSEITLILARPDVPAGSYARTAICAWATSGEAPPGFVEAVNANVVSEEPDVRNVLAKIQLGEADAGVVYASDAAAAAMSGEELVVIGFPEGVPVRAAYPIAPVAGGNTELARAFIAYVLGDEGQAVLEEYGFTGQ